MSPLLNYLGRFCKPFEDIIVETICRLLKCFRLLLKKVWQIDKKQMEKGVTIAYE